MVNSGRESALYRSKCQKREEILDVLNNQNVCKAHNELSGG